MLRSTMISSSSLLCFVLLLARCAEATIAVGDLEFESMTAVFGLPWNNGVEYKAHLQYLDAHQFLCGDDEGILSLPNVNRQLNSHHNKTTTMHSVSDDLKVALLVSRGACSFEEKARSAMLMENVAFIIIYDDRSRAHLVPMSATDPAGIDVRLIFVSHATGIQLQQMIDEQTDNSTESGGLIISMDTTAPDYAYGPNYSDTQEWMLAAMSGFFAFMACVGCLLVCIQAGYIPADSRFVAFGGGNDRPVVTEEQVNKLPVVEYSLEEHTDTACAICIDEYELGEKLRQLPCGHIFHQDCIIPWLTERHASCPLCKYDISQSEEEEEQNSSGTLWFARSYGSLARILPWNHGDRQLLNQEDEDTIVIIEEGSPEPPR